MLETPRPITLHQTSSRWICRIAFASSALARTCLKVEGGNWLIHRGRSSFERPKGSRSSYTYSHTQTPAS